MDKHNPDKKFRMNRRGFLARIVWLVPAATVGSLLASSFSCRSMGLEKNLGEHRFPRWRKGLWWDENNDPVTLYSAPPSQGGIALCRFNREGGEIWRLLDGTREPSRLAVDATRRLGHQLDDQTIHQTLLFLVELDSMGLLTGTCVFQVERSEVNQRG